MEILYNHEETFKGEKFHGFMKIMKVLTEIYGICCCIHCIKCFCIVATFSEHAMANLKTHFCIR